MSIGSATSIRDQLSETSASSDSEVDSWSDAELMEAYSEAVDRQTRDVWPTVLHKVKMNNQGLVTITFSRKIFFPAYMLRKYDSKYSYRRSASIPDSVVSGLQAG